MITVKKNNKLKYFIIYLPIYSFSFIYFIILLHLFCFCFESSSTLVLVTIDIIVVLANFIYLVGIYNYFCSNSHEFNNFLWYYKFCRGNECNTPVPDD